MVSYYSTINSFLPVEKWFKFRMHVLMSSYSDYVMANNPKNMISYINNTGSEIKPVQIYRTNIIPDFKNYYEILSASVNYTNKNLLTFSMNLAGDPNKNKNEEVETAYIWLLYYNIFGNDNNNHKTQKHDDFVKKQQIYTLIISNFGLKSKFKLKGWYAAIFNNTNNRYVIPLSKITNNMSNNQVKISISPYLIGNPILFNYLTSVMVRVNSTFLNKPPDYVMYSIPNDNSFWKKWFTMEHFIK
ncbi:MAG TPA: hypothetical protein VIY08_13220 [Candidatus Nitrosocosmicus sp.]